MCIRDRLYTFTAEQTQEFVRSSRLLEAEWTADMDKRGFKAVSYTHLDVYKRQHHDFRAAFQQGQRVAIDLTAAGVNCRARVILIISSMFRYIEYCKAFFFAFGNVLVDCCQR